ncbi:hypothetical protein ACWGLF_45440 [Streptomyces puniciscabiei]
MPHRPQLPALDTDARPLLAQSPLRTLRDEAAVCRVLRPAGNEAWLVTRHAETKALLHDERLGRFHPAPATAPKYVDNPLVEMLIIDADTAREMHRQVRALLGPQFAARRMQDLRPRVAGAAQAFAEDFASLEQPADLHRHFALRYSLSILHELIGVPVEERERAARLLADIGRDGAARTGAGPLFALFGALAEAKRAVPLDDVLPRLIAAGVPTEQAAAPAATLLMAGLESVAGFITLGVVLLTRHPERLREGLDDLRGRWRLSWRRLCTTANSPARSCPATPQLTSTSAG